MIHRRALHNHSPATKLFVIERDGLAITMITDPLFYRLFEAGFLRRFYLDEMPELANAPLGLSILYLIRQTESQAAAAGRDLVSRARSEISDEALRANLLELIETVVFYKLARFSREEV